VPQSRWYRAAVATGAHRSGAEGSRRGQLPAGGSQGNAVAGDRPDVAGLSGQTTRVHQLSRSPGCGPENGGVLELNAFFRQIKIGRQAASGRVVGPGLCGRKRAAKDASCSTGCRTGAWDGLSELNGKRFPQRPVSDVKPATRVGPACGHFRRLPLGDGKPNLELAFATASPSLWTTWVRTIPRRSRSCSSVWQANWLPMDFNAKRLIRWIVLSEPFGLSGKRMPKAGWTPRSRVTPAVRTVLLEG